VSGGRLSDLPESLSFEEALERNESATRSGRKLLVRLETDGDVTGWGEMKVPTMRMGRTVIEELLEPELVGRNVWEVESFVDEFSGFSSMYYTDITSFLGGVEMAMWDAWGKHLGVPVHQLIGGKCADTVPVAFCLGLMSPDESREHARFAAEEGFSVLKTKGSRYWETDVERIVAMHEAADGRLDFRLDPNQLWSFEDAVRVGARLEDAGIYLQYLEQPVRVDSFGTLKRLRQRLKTPIAVNEDAYFQYSISQIAEEDAIDAAVIDVVPAGGILKFGKLAAVAGEAGISLSHHSNFDLGIKLAAKLHVTASNPAVNLPIDAVYYAYEDYLLEEPLEYGAGELTVPDRPGLAGTVDAEQIERYRLD
jgi:L-alanine-DL-glutamate epimerase-like enolase superfamily enzyme